MTKSQKVNYLYRITKGERINLTPDQKKELSRYRVDPGGEYDFYLTKKNLGEYVTAVDNHKTTHTFRDWCWNTGHADRRYRNSDKKSMRNDNIKYFIGWAVAGSLFWTIFLSVFTGTASLKMWLAGAVISGILSVIARKYVQFVTIILPLILAVIVFIIRK